MLVIENLTKIYDNGFKALDNVSFEVPDGQFVAGKGLNAATGREEGYVVAVNGLTSIGEPLPSLSGFVLHQNFPNPFNQVTNVEFELRNAVWVQLTVYDLLGREVRTLVNENLSPGSYTVTWDGTVDTGQPMVSGVYLYRLMAGGPSRDSGQSFVQTRKMLLVR